MSLKQINVCGSSSDVQPSPKNADTAPVGVSKKRQDSLFDMVHAPHHHAGEIPSSLGGLGSLQHLHLGENQLSGKSLKPSNVFWSKGDVRTTENDTNLGRVDAL